MCGREEETWEHIWEECLEGEGVIMAGDDRGVLGEGGEGEEWLRRLDRLREGGGVEST